MSIVELILIAVALSMDAFAVAISTGLGIRNISLRKMLIVGLYFGGFQAGMPVIGFFIAKLFADLIIAFDHWVAFALLCFLGIRMIVGSLRKEEVSNEENSATSTDALTPSKMIPLALATSIDAMAVGVSFAFLQVSIAPAVALIGIITLAISMVGVKIGNVFGIKFKTKAEFAGGVILVLIGLKILLEHLNVISF